MLFWWGFPYFHFLIYNINSTYSTLLTYSNFFLFTNDSFRFLVYNINVYFSPTLTNFNLFHLTTSSFHFLIFNLSITFPPTLTHSNLFVFTTACFTPMLYVSIKILIGGVNCCSTCLGCLIHKTGFFGEGLDVPSFLLVMDFFSLFSFSISAAICLLNWSFVIISIKIHISRKYNRLKVCCMKSKNIWLRFIASSFSTSMSYFSRFKAILYCSNNSSIFAILMHGTQLSNGFFFFKVKDK